MARKRKGGRKPPGSEGIAGDPEAQSFALPRAPERLSSPFKQGLGDLKKRLAEAERAKKAVEARPAARAAQDVARPSVVTRSAPPGELRPARRARAGMAEDEAVALSMAMQGVKPLDHTRASRVAAHTPRVPTRTAQVAPFGNSAEEEARQRLEQLVASGVSFKIERERDFVSGLRKDAQPRVLRDLARRVGAHATLDLHGMTQPQAREAVASFVRQSARQGLDALCIVHGKGNHSEGGLGVLRDVALAALTETAAAPLVLAFVTAPEVLGGSGALLVQLTSR